MLRSFMQTEGSLQTIHFYSVGGKNRIKKTGYVRLFMKINDGRPINMLAGQGVTTYDQGHRDWLHSTKFRHLRTSAINEMAAHRHPLCTHIRTIIFLSHARMTLETEGGCD